MVARPDCGKRRAPRRVAHKSRRSSFSLQLLVRNEVSFPGTTSVKARQGRPRCSWSPTSWEVLDKSAKVEWNYLSQRRADEVVQRLKQSPCKCYSNISAVPDQHSHCPWPRGRRSMITGKVTSIYGKDINTDDIIPASFLQQSTDRK